MKNLLYIIGLVAIVAVIVAVVNTNKTEVEVPVSELDLPIAKEMMVQEMPVVMEGDDLMVEETMGETAEAVVESVVAQ